MSRSAITGHFPYFIKNEFFTLTATFEVQLTGLFFFCVFSDASPRLVELNRLLRLAKGEFEKRPDK